ncbi:Mitochondrial substrate/solute carrier [Trypanosoma melophagium]|uniref:Mitochondrial substrate/solute carrier n=1 Tax=Trypanosoma melophagium TaxID=715481 RepID=UPI00351A8898|nr:Mitochondrial substrate/solute carrier [Trypanosoma melophagium]
MVSVLGAAGLGYSASLVSIFLLYPYRDYTKVFSINSIRHVNPIQYSMARYKGMILNPSQPLLLALPWGLLYGGFVLGSGSAAGALCGGSLHGMGKVGVRTIARRLGGSRSRYDRVEYKSLIHCLQQSTKQYGILSFFSGVTATIIISSVWHGAALVALQRSSHNGFLGAWWDSFRVHAFLTFVTTPLRNTFRSALHSTERAGGVQNLSTFLAGEAAVFREAGGVLKNMLRTEGVPFFLNGVLSTTFKTSVPFGFTFALFLYFGGALPGKEEGSTRHHHHHHPHHTPLRRFS